jgi:hypothetical protein
VLGIGNSYRRLERRERMTAREIARSASPSGDHRLDAGAYVWLRETTWSANLAFIMMVAFGCGSILMRHFSTASGCFITAMVALGFGVYRGCRLMMLRKEMRFTYQNQQGD